MGSQQPKFFQRIIHGGRVMMTLAVAWIFLGVVLTFFSPPWPEGLKKWILSVIWLPVIWVAFEGLYEGWRSLPFLRSWRESFPTPDSEIGFDEQRVVYGLFELLTPIVIILVLLWLVHGFTGWPRLF